MFGTGILASVYVKVYIVSIKMYFISAWPCQQSSWNRNSSVRPSSVRVAIISEHSAQISFKFWLLLSLSHTLGLLLFNFENKIVFMNIFLCCWPYGCKIFKKLLLPQFTVAFFLKFSWIFFSIHLIKILLEILLEFWSFWFLKNFRIF